MINGIPFLCYDLFVVFFLKVMDFRYAKCGCEERDELLCGGVSANFFVTFRLVFRMKSMQNISRISNRIRGIQMQCYVIRF